MNEVVIVFFGFQCEHGLMKEVGGWEGIEIASPLYSHDPVLVGVSEEDLSVKL